MLDIRRILNDNALMQVFTGLDRSEFAQLFPHFVQTYNTTYPKSHRLSVQNGQQSTLSGAHQQLLFILFCFRWQPTLTVLSHAFGLAEEQISRWIQHLQPVLMQVYAPQWEAQGKKGAFDLAEGQLQSLTDIVEQFPEAAQAIAVKPNPAQRDSALNAPDRWSQLLPKRWRQYQPILLPAAMVAAIIAIPGLIFIFWHNRALLTAAQVPVPSSPAENSTPVTAQRPGQSTVVSPDPDNNSHSADSQSPVSAANPSNQPTVDPSSPLSVPLESQPYDEQAPTVAADSGLELFNHLAYPEADPTRLVSAGVFIRESYEREEFLDFEAADAFNAMRADAAQQGVDLILISGFRTVVRQEELFATQVEKRGTKAAAAELSAPPGHSEHHTGYALDIGDDNRPDTDIKYAFEDTEAYRWLKNNAASFGFEESFPKGNPQGVSFEPWHWRYIGSARAQSTFVLSKTLFP